MLQKLKLLKQVHPKAKAALKKVHPKSKAAWMGEGTGASIAIVLAWVVKDVLHYPLSIEVAMALGFLLVKITSALAKFMITWREESNETSRT